MHGYHIAWLLSAHGHFAWRGRMGTFHGEGSDFAARIAVFSLCCSLDASPVSDALEIRLNI